MLNTELPSGSFLVGEVAKRNLAGVAKGFIQGGDEMRHGGKLNPNLGSEDLRQPVLLIRGRFASVAHFVCPFRWLIALSPILVGMRVSTPFRPVIFSFVLPKLSKWGEVVEGIKKKSNLSL